MKKIFSLILAVVLSVAMLTACGGQEQPAGSANNGGSAAAPAATEEPEAEETSEAEEEIEAEEQAEAEVQIEACSEDDFATESLGDGTCKVTAYQGDSEVVVIPDVIRDEKVVVIAGVGTVGIKKVVLPDSVEVIDAYAFNYCPDLEEIVFGSGLKEVGYFAFNSCDSLTEIVFPEGMTTLSEMPLGICLNLKEVYIPASVTEIGMLFYAETMPELVVVTPAGSAAEKQATEDGLTVKNP